MFHPNAPCYRSKDTATIHKQHEAAKKREYNQRVQNVEHGVLHLSYSQLQAAWERKEQRFTKDYSRHVVKKQEKPYSIVMGWIRCQLSFAIIRSAIMCIRGTRSAFAKPIFEGNLTLAAAEGQTPREELLTLCVHVYRINK